TNGVSSRLPRATRGPARATAAHDDRSNTRSSSPQHHTEARLAAPARARWTRGWWLVTYTRAVPTANPAAVETRADTPTAGRRACPRPARSRTRTPPRWSPPRPSPPPPPAPAG